MSTALARLPDETPCYVPGVGEVTVGAIRGALPEEKTALDDAWEATLLMWEDKATRNLCVQPWERPGDTPSERKA